MLDEVSGFGAVPEFDALAESISARLGCDLSLISVVHEEALLALGHSDAPGDGAGRLSVLRDTVCGHTIDAAQLVNVPDIRQVAHLKQRPAVATFDIGAYLGVPLWREDVVVGALCALSHTPRIWQDSELRYLRHVADLAESKIDRHLLRSEQSALSAALAENDAVLAALSTLRGRAFTVQNAQGDLVFASSALETELGLGTRAVMSLPALARSVALSGCGEATLDIDLLENPELVLHVRTQTTADGLILSDWSCTRPCGDFTRV